MRSSIREELRVYGGTYVPSDPAEAWMFLWKIFSLKQRPQADLKSRNAKFRHPSACTVSCNHLGFAAVYPVLDLHMIASLKWTGEISMKVGDQVGAQRDTFRWRKGMLEWLTRALRPSS